MTVFSMRGRLFGHTERKKVQHSHPMKERNLRHVIVVWLCQHPILFNSVITFWHLRKDFSEFNIIIQIIVQPQCRSVALQLREPVLAHSLIYSNDKGNCWRCDFASLDSVFCFHLSQIKTLALTHRCPHGLCARQAQNNTKHWSKWMSQTVNEVTA